MKKFKSFQIPFILALTFFLGIAISACSNDDDKGGSTPDNRNVKYEITGNYSGKLVIVYSNEHGAAETVMSASLPWSKEITLQTVNTGAYSANTDTPGIAGQTATAKIIVGGEVKKSETQIADENGRINFSMLSYTF